MINMVFADMLSLHVPGVLTQVATGIVDGVTLSAGLMAAAALVLQIPIAMIVLSQLLADRACRWASSGAVAVTALFVVGGGSLKPHYLIMASAELIAMAGILVLVWRHRRSGPGAALP